MSPSVSNSPFLRTGLSLLWYRTLAALLSATHLLARRHSHAAFACVVLGGPCGLPFEIAPSEVCNPGYCTSGFLECDGMSAGSTCVSHISMQSHGRDTEWARQVVVPRRLDLETIEVPLLRILPRIPVWVPQWHTPPRRSSRLSCCQV